MELQFFFSFEKAFFEGLVNPLHPQEHAGLVPILYLPPPIIAQILERNVAPIKVSRVKMEMQKSQRDIYFSSS